jgi:hypothetical protein
MGARARLTVWWNGAALDRLIDQRHAEVVEAICLRLAGSAWRKATEVTFSEFGERGSLDVFAAQEAANAACIFEAKSEWGSLEETLRRLDVKVRLAPKLCRLTFGFTPRIVGAVVVLPEDRNARRIADRHQATLGTALPARGPEVRRWLREPIGPLRGLWFLSDVGAVRSARPPPAQNGQIRSQRSRRVDL